MVRRGSKARFFRSASALALPCFIVALACGGSGAPESKTADDEPASERRESRSSISASSEIGALDEAKVTTAFRGAQGELEKCLAAGAERNELEGGDIAFFVKIDTSGQVVHAHAERSTLGDRETEKCMLGALKRRTWPAPQGGDIGLARNSFNFDMPNDVRPPTEWDADRVREALAEVSAKLDECKNGASGELTATLYVDPEGAALTAGVASSDESGESAADCITKVLKSAKYPSPGSWPAKVTFTL